MAPYHNLFYTGAIFLFFVEKCKKLDCPLLYEEVPEDIIKTAWTEQCGNVLRIEVPGAWGRLH